MPITQRIFKLLAPYFCMLVGLDIIPTNDVDDYEL